MFFVSWDLIYTLKRYDSVTKPESNVEHNQQVVTMTVMGRK